MSRLQRFSRALLEFSLRLYTRVNIKPGTTWGPLGIAVPEPETIHLDNGKRMIAVKIVHGPFWTPTDEETPL